MLPLKAGAPAELLRDGLTDPSGSIRRSAAIAIGERGDAGAKEALFAQLGRKPAIEVIEALTAIGDDAAIVHPGKCDERHPGLADAVLGVLQDMESDRAARLARQRFSTVRSGLQVRLALR